MIEGIENLSEVWTKAWEKNTSRIIDQTMRNQKLLEQMGRALFHWSEVKTQSNQMLERWMSFFRLPTRSDLGQVLYGLHQIDMRLADISDQLAQSDLRMSQVEAKLEQLGSSPAKPAEPTKKTARKTTQRAKAKGEGK